MPTVSAPSTPAGTLDANLAGLGERNADVARAIRAAAPPGDLRFAESRAGPLTATLGGVPLASRHHPREEAERLADSIDLLEHAVVVVLGFGLGHHVEALARRLGKAGLIVVYEPDVGLLRAAFERIDHTRWLADALVLFVTDADDRGALGRKLAGGEAMLAQGVEFLEHPPSRARLGRGSAEFSATLSGHVTAAKTTFVTTLVRAIDTVRNLLANVGHYVGGPGVADLEHAAAGKPAVVVSAGPSLQRNMHLLADPAVRDRCVIVAVQTTLKPLLRAGIRPHFVTALDYHEISRRFYEGLTPADVEGITLVAEPKAHPAILDAFPGTVRCCASPFLDRLLGDDARDMGTLPAGATVAHLAVYLARWLGCNPVAMIGQDLGFPDGLYYAPGTAIHDVWAPELNPFNTIAMMEWQRIVRYRPHLHKTVDVSGKSIYTDAQMRTYLQQFERDFAAYAEAGVEIIDATEGGVRKQHAKTMPLAEVLDRHLADPLSPLPLAAPPDPARSAAAEARLAAVEREVADIGAVSRRTVRLLQRMLRDQTDGARMARHFAKLERERARIDERLESFKLLESLNQLGTFKRLRADRRLHMQRELGDLPRQRAQLERDVENVRWIVEAAGLMTGQIAVARRILRGGPPVDAGPAPRPEPAATGRGAARRGAPAGRVAAIVPFDPDRNGRGIARSLAEPWDGAPVVQRTLERLGRCRELESIVLIAPEGADVETLLDRNAIGRPVEIVRTPGSPFGPEQPAIAAARLWADTCWRGGIGGASVYDEAVCPGFMHELVTRRGLAAAVVAAPDWPLVDVTPDTGIPALVRRFREHPAQHTVVFTQAPPGLSACLVTARTMAALAQRTRISTIGGLLVYQPHAPQGDPIGGEGNVQIDHRLRHALVRATFDSPRGQRRLRRALAAGAAAPDGPAIAAALERDVTADEDGPEQVVLELTTRRRGGGLFARHPGGDARRPPLDRELAARIFGALGRAGDVVVTFGGAGDPLLHPEFDRFAEMARAAGVRAVHVRTALREDRAVLDRLLAAPVDVVSVDLHADREDTYRTMMGAEPGAAGFREVLENIGHLVRHRRPLTGSAGGTGLAMPWIVPRLQRRAETYEDIDTFYDRWQHLLGAVVIEPVPAGPGGTPDTLAAAVTPPPVVARALARRMTIYGDGAVPVSELDGAARRTAGHLGRDELSDVWPRLLAARRAAAAEPALGILRP